MPTIKWTFGFHMAQNCLRRSCNICYQIKVSSRGSFDYITSFLPSPNFVSWSSSEDFDGAMRHSSQKGLILNLVIPPQPSSIPHTLHHLIWTTQPQGTPFLRFWRWQFKNWIISVAQVDIMFVTCKQEFFLRQFCGQERRRRRAMIEFLEVDDAFSNYLWGCVRHNTIFMRRIAFTS